MRYKHAVGLLLVALAILIPAQIMRGQQGRRKPTTPAPLGSRLQNLGRAIFGEEDSKGTNPTPGYNPRRRGSRPPATKGKPAPRGTGAAPRNMAPAMDENTAVANDDPSSTSPAIDETIPDEPVSPPFTAVAPRSSRRGKRASIVTADSASKGALSQVPSETSETTSLPTDSPSDDESTYGSSADSNSADNNSAGSNSADSSSSGSSSTGSGENSGAPRSSRRTKGTPAIRPAPKTPRLSQRPKIDTSAPAAVVTTPADAESPKASEATDSNENGELAISTGPKLSARLTGPRQMIVGAETEYDVQIVNDGQMLAAGVVVNLKLPTGIEIVQHNSSTGSVAQTAGGMQEASLEWEVGELSAQTVHTLRLIVVAHQRQTMDLQLGWTHDPVYAVASVESSQPELELAISGPKEVEFGKSTRYTLTASNPGSADATNVVVTLMPIRPGEQEPSTHNLGKIPAGGEKSVQLELTARDAGNIILQADVTADHGLRAEAEEEVLVRRAELAVEATGPKSQFAGAQSVHKIEITNTGNAAALHVKLKAVLPSGAELLFGSKGCDSTSHPGEAHWAFDSIPAGETRSVEIRSVMQSAGNNDLAVSVSADGSLSAATQVATQVIAVADLVLEVTDPAGPLPVGREMNYEIRVKNRGSRAAEGVSVVIYFSEGLEPVGNHGGAYDADEGILTLGAPIAIGAGRNAQFSIRARASQQGNMRIRVEVEHSQMGTKLTQEESTMFYDENGTTAEPSTEDKGEAAQEVTPPAKKPAKKAIAPAAIPQGEEEAMPTEDEEESLGENSSDESEETSIKPTSYLGPPPSTRESDLAGTILFGPGRNSSSRGTASARKPVGGSRTAGTYPSTQHHAAPPSEFVPEGTSESLNKRAKRR